MVSSILVSDVKFGTHANGQFGKIGAILASLASMAI
jgi:hypothetical protein